jgi:hypothetical protein
MDCQLQLKPFEKKDGFKYKIIQITDITLHSSHKQPTQAIGKKIKQSFEQNKPGRFYGFGTKELQEESGLREIIDDLIKKDPEFLKMIIEEEKKGVKILLSFPEDGVPIKLGSDTEQFIASKNGQRVVRGINQ